MAGYRNRDMRVERVLARFMDDHLYSDPRFTKAERTDSKDAQMTGSDIILSMPSLGISEIVVDEKGMTQYMSNPLPTFAMELSFLNNNGEETIGWFIDDTKATEYYMLLWPRVEAGADSWNVNYDDIIEVEYILVSKGGIRKYLETKGYSRENLILKNNSIRRGSQSGPIDKGVEDFWFYKTKNLVEEPINIVIRKKIYKSLAIMSGTLTKQK